MDAAQNRDKSKLRYINSVQHAPLNGHPQERVSFDFSECMSVNEIGISSVPQPVIRNSDTLTEVDASPKVVFNISRYIQDSSQVTLVS